MPTEQQVRDNCTALATNAGKIIAALDSPGSMSEAEQRALVACTIDVTLDLLAGLFIDINRIANALEK